MKFNLVFETSGDCIPFEIKYNQDLFEYFLSQCNNKQQNAFSVSEQFSNSVSLKIKNLNQAIIESNKVLKNLLAKPIPYHTELVDYLDQDYLNKIHYLWADSQLQDVDIDTLSTSTDDNVRHTGIFLNDQYPNHIRIIKIAEAMQKLGCIVPYEEINMGVHRLEDSFSLIEFAADKKWEVFENICLDNMVTNNDKVNFNFGYTYVGRQYYNKFRFFDKKLKYQDNYNYETLEFAFQLSLQQPETIPFSVEALKWAESNNIKLTAEQIPIGNMIDIDNKLFDYRKILYNNIKQRNKAKLIY